MISPDDLKERYIPFSSLQYSTEAFIDYCIPECRPKYNYALVGPGVSQNPDQPVSLREPHGFQVGGVSIPHGKINTPHMHFTCEVFICARGNWKLQWGFNPFAIEASIGEGDIISVPTWIYRGFTNVGADNGFLFTALGGDSTGGVLWAPSTLKAAAAQGVVLTSDYRMVDTRKGDSLKPGESLLEPMTDAEIAALRRWTPEEMMQRVVKFSDLRWTQNGLLDSTLPGCGAQLAPVIGYGMLEDRDAMAPVMNAHGVSLEWLRIPVGGKVSCHRVDQKQVMIAKAGNVDLEIETTGGPVSFSLVGGEAGWDSFSLPSGCWRQLRQKGEDEALILVMSAGDQRKRIEWDPQVMQEASASGLALDANGYVAQRRFVERAQR